MNRTPVTLLERLRHQEDSEAWSQFIQLYTPILYSWARRLGLTEHDASDLVQDVFVVLVRKLPEFQYDRTKRFRSWLRTVLRNKWAERLRKGEPLAVGDDLPEQVEPDAVLAFWESEYQQHLVNESLRFIREHFEPATWKAFWEVVYKSRPVSEVAEELKMTPNAVYIARSRVLARLSEHLKGLLD